MLVTIVSRYTGWGHDDHTLTDSLRDLSMLNKHSSITRTWYFGELGDSETLFDSLDYSETLPLLFPTRSFVETETFAIVSGAELIMASALLHNLDFLYCARLIDGNAEVKLETDVDLVTSSPRFLAANVDLEIRYGGNHFQIFTEDQDIVDFITANYQKTTVTDRIRC